MDPSYGVHADELSRRICELELAPLRRPSIAESENGPHSNTEERSHLRPDQESHNKHTEADVGVTTPPEVPAPPPSPHHEPSTSDGALADIDTNTDAPGGEQPKKKKRKKKSSGKNKKPAPTGFEGKLPLAHNGWIINALQSSMLMPLSLHVNTKKRAIFTLRECPNIVIHNSANRPSQFTSLPRVGSGLPIARIV